MDILISNTSIKKAYKLFGTITTDKAVNCLNNWYDTFHSECFCVHTKEEIPFIKAVIFLLSVNRINEPKMKEYLEWYKNN